VEIPPAMLFVDFPAEAIGEIVIQRHADRGKPDDGVGELLPCALCFFGFDIPVDDQGGSEGKAAGMVRVMDRHLFQVNLDGYKLHRQVPFRSLFFSSYSRSRRDRTGVGETGPFPVLTRIRRDVIKKEEMALD